MKIYNTLTRMKEEFDPLEPGKVRIYVCGITVYDYCHLGHARMLVVFDMITRYLRASGYEVNYIRNITDIDDKIIIRANETGENFHELADRFIKAMNEDVDALGILRPDLEPRATDYIDQIIRMIEKLINTGYAYVTADGDVFYDVSKFSSYGKLSGKNIDDLRAGSRVDIQESKDNPMDFALWKSAKKNEPDWDSPWGRGRPGWHIECSAMAIHTLGEHFDIHGGGQDLQFPHHENEIAQSTGATGKPFANVWIHNGFVRIDDEKMSKSLGNVFTVREIMKQYQPEVIRFFLLSSHYRSPLSYSDAHLNEAKTALTRLYKTLRDVSLENEDNGILNGFRQKFFSAMDDDFNTREAITVLHEIAHELNKEFDNSSARSRQLAFTLIKLGEILGLLQGKPDEFLQYEGIDIGMTNVEIQKLVDERIQAKQAKDYARADKIRHQLAELGVTLEDNMQGTTWQRG